MPYPYYMNPYSNAYPTNYWNPVNPVIPNQVAQQIPQQPQYMINVDGENAAKSWQPNTVPQPNTIIPLFDSDGQHVYFKTYDAYGRMNPLRKGRIVFDQEINVSETSSDPVAQDMSGYVTKEELNKMKEEIEETLRYHIDKLGSSQSKTNQNGSTKSR